MSKRDYQIMITNHTVLLDDMVDSIFEVFEGNCFVFMSDGQIHVQFSIEGNEPAKKVTRMLNLLAERGIYYV